MKKMVWLTIAAASAATIYFIVKKCALSSEPATNHGPKAKMHHLTNAFSKAKRNAEL